MKNVTTLRQIAHLAGVSASTVSRALHGDERISQATRNRIQAIAEQRGYWSTSARPIGLVIANPQGGLHGDAFFHDVVDGVLAYRGPERPVTIEVTHARPTSPLPTFLRSTAFAGLIVGGIPIASEWIESLLGTQIPTVFIGRYTEAPSRLCSVLPDNVRGGWLAGEHLLTMGYESFWFVGGSRLVPTFRDRYEGFLAALAQAGHSLPEAHTLTTEPTAEAAAHAIRDITPLLRGRTGIFCATDWQASGALQALRAADISVPQDVGVVGYADLDLAQHTSPPLTSISIDRRQIGYLACRILEDAVIGELRQPIQVHVQPELKARASTAPPTTPCETNEGAT